MAIFNSHAKLPEAMLDLSYRKKGKARNCNNTSVSPTRPEIEKSKVSPSKQATQMEKTRGLEDEDLTQGHPYWIILLASCSSGY